jgi:hypothetical protein
MIFNADRGAYEKTLFLKQGYYNYSYVTITDNPARGIFQLQIQKEIIGRLKITTWCWFTIMPLEPGRMN